MNPIDRAILDALRVNLGYESGDTVGIVVQEWAAHLGDERRGKFDDALSLCMRMHTVFQANDVDSTLLSYVPSEARNGVDASADMYRDAAGLGILFMPTVFSLTHTPFRRAMTEQGTRVASMPGFTMGMFQPGGPMDTDYRKLAADTKEIERILAGSRMVHVTGLDTDMHVEIMSETAHASTGMLDGPGAYGNLPGAECYAVPVEDGETHGFFTVPEGWGGPMPLPFPVRFLVEKARIVDIVGADAAQQAWIDEHIKPSVLGQPDFNVLAELGIGTNPNLTPAYVAEHGWSILTAEKISGSAHFANGNSKGFGGSNDVPVHIDWVVPGVEITYE